LPQKFFQTTYLYRRASMYLLFLLSLMGCAKKHLVKEARSAFTNENCVKTLEIYMRNAKCGEVHLKKEPSAIVIKCKKEEAAVSIWDRYWFRISPAVLKIDSKQLAEVERHTVCIDNQHRIEAYPPN